MWFLAQVSRLTYPDHTWDIHQKNSGLQTTKSTTPMGIPHLPTQKGDSMTTWDNPNFHNNTMFRSWSTQGQPGLRRRYGKRGPGHREDSTQREQKKGKFWNPEGEKATGSLLRWRSPTMVKLVLTHNTLLLKLMAVRKQQLEIGARHIYIWLEWKERGQTEVSSTNLKWLERNHGSVIII